MRCSKRCTTKCAMALAVCAAFSSFGLSGCGGPAKRAPRSAEELAADREKILDRIVSRRSDMLESVAARIEAEHAAYAASGGRGEAPVLDILILSGGGDFGAFGAGVLHGWGQVEDPEWKRPEFDAVTGVSTGALIAPYAFIGTDEAYAEILTFYENPQQNWVRMRPGLFFLPKNVSLADPSGLWKFLQEKFDAAHIAEVADAARDNRQLLIGTTSVDLGMMRIWDLGRESRAAEETGDPGTFFNIMKASASIPGAFPPIDIDGHLYADGGATMNMFFPAQRRRLLEDPPGTPFSEGVPWPKVRLWAIVNNKLIVRPENTQLKWTSIVGRSLGTAIRSNLVLAMRDLETYAHAMRNKGIDFEFRFIAMPNDFEVSPDAGFFDKDTMTRLGDIGEALGADPSNWRTRVPSPEWPYQLLDRDVEPASDEQ